MTDEPMKCAHNHEVECPGPIMDRRQEDEGIKRVLDLIENRFNSVEKRFDKVEERFESLSHKILDISVDIGKHSVELKNVIKREETQSNHKWAIIIAVIGAWMVHLATWVTKGIKG